MGLSASQARLLTITARKSDCEYESMRLSHQKIALSRDMNRISAEYDTALAQTKLMYDFYGTNSEQVPLNYNLLMTPSIMNNFTPTPVTDSSGRLVLDGRLAKAARDAGIPQEGLDGLPSSDVRNTFIDSLAASGYITQLQGDNIKKTTYNQLAGVGSTDLVNVNTVDGTLQDLLAAASNEYFDFSDIIGDSSAGGIWDGNQFVDKTVLLEHSSGNKNVDAAQKLSLVEIMNSDILFIAKTDRRHNNLTVDGGATDVISNLTIWETFMSTMEGLLDTGDSYTQAALAYARRQIEDMVENLGAGQDKGEGASVGRVPAGGSGATYEQYGKNIHDNFALWHNMGEKRPGQGVRDKSRDDVAADAIGFVGTYAHDNDGSNDNDKMQSYATINISNVFKAYLTYFAQYMEGLDVSTYEVTKSKETSNLIDDMFTFTIVTDVDTSGDNLLIASFYDTLLNQICTKGWTENDKVKDQEYLQESLKNGNMYISTLADDGYYYQGNYATNSYIKEVTNEEKIAQAEAKYTREKNKISHKENILDMKMKNLDTEISSLSTEYDTIKNVISKNIERGFKRYS